MEDEEKKQITDIVNAFRLVNKDIRDSFNTMCEKLESNRDFEKWKKSEKGLKQAKADYWDAAGFFHGYDDWYYLSCYGMRNKKVVGFTFVISINYNEKEDIDYSNFIDQLDKNINKNAPMLCIFGTYEPIDIHNIKLTDNNGIHYVDSVLQLTDGWENYKKNKIKYNEWIDVEIQYLEDEKIIEGYEGWYKRAKVKIRNITDISNNEEAQSIIDDLIYYTP